MQYSTDVDWNLYDENKQFVAKKWQYTINQNGDISLLPNLNSQENSNEQTNQNIVQSDNVQTKRPTIFTVLGWLSIIWGIFSIIQSVLAITAFWVSYKYLTPELIESISLSFQIFFLGIPIILSILYFTEWIWFLKLKSWLPGLLVVTLILAIILQTIVYFDSIWYSINPAKAFVKYFITDAIPLYIGGAIIWYTFKNKNIFTK